MKALIVNDASLAGHHGSALVTEQIQRIGRKAGADIVAGWDWESVLPALKSDRVPFDLIIVNGEGSVHHDSKSALRIASIAKSLRAKGVPAFMVNATVEACSPAVLDGLAAFRACYVRDTASRDLLAKAHIPAKVVPDLTLSALANYQSQDGGGPLLLTDLSDERKTAQLVAIASHWPDTNILTLRCPPPWPVNGSRFQR